MNKPDKAIDTHVHIWNFDQAEYSWLEGDESILNRNYELSALEESRITAGITEGILVQAANNPEDTDWMLRVAADTDWIKGVVGWAPLQDPLATERILAEKYLRNPFFKGVRHLIHNEPDPGWLLQDTVVESLRILADHDLTYDVVGIIPAHITTALKVAEKVPGLRMVFDHLNQPPIGGGFSIVDDFPSGSGLPPGSDLQTGTGERFGDWGELMKEAAGHENFYVKISGLGTASGNFTGWKAADLEPVIEFVLEYFGKDRCFCGGDWPVSLLAGSYEKMWESYRAILKKLLDEEGYGKVLYKNASDFYSLQAE